MTYQGLFRNFLRNVFKIEQRSPDRYVPINADAFYMPLEEALKLVGLPQERPITERQLNQMQQNIAHMYGVSDSDNTGIQKTKDICNDIYYTCMEQGNKNEPAARKAVAAWKILTTEPDYVPATKQRDQIPATLEDKIKFK